MAGTAASLKPTAAIRSRVSGQVIRSEVLQIPTLRHVWAAQGISVVGSQITAIALPTIAILGLRSSALAVALIQTVFYIGLAGTGPVVARRIERSPGVATLAAVQTIAFAAVLSVPLAHLFGRIVLPQIYCVAFVAGACASAFEVAAQTCVVRTVRAIGDARTAARAMTGANSLFEVNRSASQVTGPALGGLLIRQLGAPLAVAADALSYLLSLAVLRPNLRRRGAVDRCFEMSQEPTASVAEPHAAGAGFRVVMRDALLRGLTLTAATVNLGGGIIGGLFLIYVYRVLGLSPLAAGLIMALGNVGALLGAMLIPGLLERFGFVPTIQVAAFALAAAFWLIVAASFAAPAVILIVYELVFGIARVSYGIASSSLRQLVTPDNYQARVTALTRLITIGVLPIGMAVGGLVASTFSVTVAVVLGASVASLTAGAALAVPRDDHRLPAPARAHGFPRVKA